jgi:hypothetical protein
VGKEHFILKAHFFAKYELDHILLVAEYDDRVRCLHELDRTVKIKEIMDV